MDAFSLGQSDVATATEFFSAIIAIGSPSARHIKRAAGEADI